MRLKERSTRPNTAKSIIAATARIRKQAARIMSGARMPRGPDPVSPQEIVERRGGRGRDGPLKKGGKVRMGGEAVQAGPLAIGRGTVLPPQELGLIASLGLWQILVHRR